MTELHLGNTALEEGVMETFNFFLILKIGGKLFCKLAYFINNTKQKEPKLSICLNVLTFLVESNKCFRDSLSDSVHLGDMTTTLNGDSDVDSGEFLLQK